MRSGARAARRAALLALVMALVAAAAGHGMMTQPRVRGALRCPTRNVTPQSIGGADDAVIDYCPHCQNAGGRFRVRETGGDGTWRMFSPETGGRRGGFSLCGDPSGSYDHMKAGRYANPPSRPYSAVYEPGSVASFEFDATANHVRRPADGCG
jgi:hypothetical protein